MSRWGTQAFDRDLYFFRDDFSALLSKAGPTLTIKALLEALQQTVEFESSMAKKWSTSVCHSQASLLLLLTLDPYIS
jgi:hypothetical protein